MKRRSFLAMLGLAPAVAAVPAAAATDQVGIGRALESIRPHVDGELRRITVEHKATIDAIEAYDRGRLSRLATDLHELKRRGAL